MGARQMIAVITFRESNKNSSRLQQTLKLLASWRHALSIPAERDEIVETSRQMFLSSYTVWGFVSYTYL